MNLAGIDLAWQGERNPSAIAFGSIKHNRLILESLEPTVYGLARIIEQLTKQECLQGIAIDAPLIIKNDTGQRLCEKALSRDYGGRKASCHTSNKRLYPEALSVKLSTVLQTHGFNHLAPCKWQIECYPHPAIIECFNLPERLAYKKGSVAERKAGQIELARLILSLEHSKVLPLTLPKNLQGLLSATYIKSLKGISLKSNEDALDAIVCLYIAGLYSIKAGGIVYGDKALGYIFVPKMYCS